MKKFLTQVAVYLAVIVFLGSVISWVAGYFLANSYFYKPDFIVNYLPPASHFNYVLAGSSRGLTTINTVEVDDKLGLKGFNLSMDDTGLPSQFLMIQHYFESGNSADYCVLTLDLGHMEESEKKLSDNDYRFVSYSDRPYVQEHYQTYEKGIIRPLAISRYLPVFAFSQYNMELFWPAGLAMLMPRYTNRFDLNGNYSYPETQLVPDRSDIEWSKIEKTIQNPILEDLKSYLTSKNCKLVLYIAPYFGTDVSIREPIGYSVINHSAALRTPDYFFDKDHVNNLGKVKSTELFIHSFGNIMAQK